MLKHIKVSFLQSIQSIFRRSIQKRLGYASDSKLLIIHADDMGLSRSENAASIEALERGLVNSGSVMVPCPAFKEIVEYSKANPKKDIGVHLTITSEWNSYKWGPVLPANEVPSIVGSDGFFPESKLKLSERAIADEIEKEFRAQVITALKSGIDITHIDTHMFTAFSDIKILKKYISVGKEFKLPLLLTYDLPVRSWFLKNRIIVDNLFCAKPEDFQKGLDNYYAQILKSLKPGLNCILIHTAFDNREMQHITGNRPDYGSAWRQADFDFFTSEECRLLIKENNIHLITWREIRDLIVG